jgi:hypothetical protein
VSTVSQIALALLALLALFRPALGSWMRANCSLGTLATPTRFYAGAFPRAHPNTGARSGGRLQHASHLRYLHGALASWRLDAGTGQTRPSLLASCSSWLSCMASWLSWLSWRRCWANAQSAIGYLAPRGYLAWQSWQSWQPSGRYWANAHTGRWQSWQPSHWRPAPAHAAPRRFAARAASTTISPWLG